MENEEDTKFLSMQRDDSMSCTMAGVDMSPTQRKSRKRKRQTEMNVRKLKSNAIVATLDRVNISNRKVMFLVGSVAHSGGL